MLLGSYLVAGALLYFDRMRLKAGVRCRQELIWASPEFQASVTWLSAHYSRNHDDDALSSPEYHATGSLDASVPTRPETLSARLVVCARSSLLLAAGLWHCPSPPVGSDLGGLELSQLESRQPNDVISTPADYACDKSWHQADVTHRPRMMRSEQLIVPIEHTRARERAVWLEDAVKRATQIERAIEVSHSRLRARLAPSWKMSISDFRDALCCEHLLFAIASPSHASVERGPVVLMRLIAFIYADALAYTVFADDCNYDHNPDHDHHHHNHAGLTDPPSTIWAKSMNADCHGDDADASRTAMAVLLVFLQTMIIFIIVAPFKHLLLSAVRL